MCLKAGVVLARALQRVLVLPIFTDSAPEVDVSKYVSLDCFRRNYQAVTFDEFRQSLCSGVGLGLPSHDRSVEAKGAKLTEGARSNRRAGAADPKAGAKRHNTFCTEGATLQLENSYSLSDYSGLACWARREDISNARDLGIEIKQCSHVPPASGTGNQYDLEYVKQVFANRPEKLLLFLDLFGVDVLPSAGDLADTISEPGQMCSWMPAEQAAGAADMVMQSLIPLSGESASVAATAAFAASASASAAALDTAASQRTHSRALISEDGGADQAAASDSGAAAAADAVAAAPAPIMTAPPPMRLRGTRGYMAVHLRRSDWFYYCAGKRNCFHSMTEVGAWLNQTLHAKGLTTLYASTNADARERGMLRRAISGRVLFWDDVLAELRRWQALAPANSKQRLIGLDAAALAAAAGAQPGSQPPAWVAELPLDDPLMVQMVEKAICMQAVSFVSSSGSTFSNQIRAFRNGGMEHLEQDMLVRKFGAAAVTASTGAPQPSTAVALSGADEQPTYEQPTYLLDEQGSAQPDERRYPDFHNPNIFFEQVKRFRDTLLRILHRAWYCVTGHGAPVQSPAPPPSQATRIPPPSSLLYKLAFPVRFFQKLVLTLEDAHAVAGANRFVEMYTGGRVVGLVLEGRQSVPPSVLASCVASAAARVGAIALHVSMADVPPHQQVLIMQELEAQPALSQITRMGGPHEERGNTFTLLWRGDGLGRRAENAMLQELPVYVEKVDKYVLAKSRILLGDTRAGLFKEVSNIRELYDFGDARDGACGPLWLKP
ncbi:hypothetical protein HYH03_014167 [Edaphochlamys debaryana]|uniref:O-fucosyltransferase family protein n=1 Tax=Edaphochlamys debaryana TaxID=47281 RepID=A0A835XWS0_9CHLO|nr:hypothetical protein HYH03_014167 [Edaphochlamys debaryana]|eukprot:KAG2487189.1 hypothetical protein HYH03_014167 [Edaphochlamys debaryana]